MKKKSIFIKIYLSFWLFTLLIIFTQISFDELTQSGPFYAPFNKFNNGMLSAYVYSMISLSSNKGSGSINEIDEQLKKSNDIEIYIINDKMIEITGKSLPSDAIAIYKNSLKNKKPEHLDLNDHMLIAETANGPDSKTYTLVRRIKSKDGEQFLGRNKYLFIRMLLIIFISAAACYMLARYMTSPVIALREATQKFSEGDLGVRIGDSISSRKDEFSELAAAFDRMAGRIESLMTQQRQLLGDISHELRSPLSRLVVALELARKQSGPEAKKSLERIETETETLNSLIGDVLSLTRLESGIDIFQVSPVNIGELTQKLAADADFEARGYNKSVKIKQCENIIIAGDEELLKRAIENVIRNAVKYSCENTEVTICVRKKDNSTIEIAVTDQGPGVAESELANIFHPFYRISNSRDRKTGGSGLGLAITQKAVLLHKGCVSAKNNSAKGLIITISLPVFNK